MEYGYSLITQIKIYNTDPICSIDLNDELLLFGTMLGYCGYYLIKPKEKLIKISEKEDEHISATQIRKNKLCIAVGDEKVIIVEKNLEENDDDNIKEVFNYEDDSDHFKHCERTFCMLKENLLLSIELNIPKEDEKISKKNSCDWSVKNIDNNKSFNGEIEMYNFWAPFDFDGKLLIFVEFLSEEKRYFNIYSCYDKKFLKKIRLWKEKDYIGHISHAKFFGEKNKKIFLVHSYNKCQIRNMEFKLIKEFQHGGKEIIACDIYWKSEGKLKVCLVDINCDVFLYEEKNDEEKYLFNLHKLNCIDEEIKQQKFFSMGYPYFVKYHKNIIAISTDQGCFLLKKEDF